MKSRFVVSLMLVVVLLAGCAPAITPAPTEEPGVTPAPTEEPGVTAAPTEAAPVTPSPEAGPTSGGTLIKGINGNPVNLNPIITTSQFDRTVMNVIFDGLLDLDEDLTPRGALAESWSASEDGTEWTFQLRADVKWHDGVDFTADDVKFTFDKVLDPDVNSPLRSSLVDVIESVEVIDPLTVRLRTFEPYGPLLTMLGSYMGVYIAPKHILETEANLTEAPFNREPIGTGPFKFVSWSVEDVIELERFDQFWGGAVPNIPGTPYIERWIVKVVPDPNAANAQLQTGELTIAQIRQTDYLAMKDAPGLNLVPMAANYVNYLALNNRNPLFQDVRVRKALAYGIDRQGIIESVLQGLGGVAHSPTFPDSWGYNQALEGAYPFDPEEASELLAEAGWVDRDSDGVLVKDGQRFEFTIQQYSEWEPYVKMAQVVQDNMSDLGIKVDIELSEYNTWFSTILSPGEFDAAVWSFAATDPDLSDWLLCDVHPPDGQNWFFYCNEEVDQLLEEGRTSTDLETRRETYYEMQELVMDDMPLIPLNWEKTLYGVNPAVRNLRTNVERFSTFGYSMWLEQ